ncbi:hypothetical protein AAD018_000525 [Aestuariibius insulae]|uniref:hypothetical protein n=1 Tax=Aestuariibius insulae TaxID=2058287 RepID=UPI00345ED7B1
METEKLLDESMQMLDAAEENLDRGVQHLQRANALLEQTERRKSAPIQNSETL